MELAVLRDDMVDSLEHDSKGVVSSDRLSAAMRAVPRHEFVEDDRLAYADRSFEHRGTRVLAPSTAARLLEALDAEDGDSVLVVGAGVGYTAAVLAEVVGERNVHAVDITRDVVWDARSNLASAGYEGVFVDYQDGADGLPEYAPFDRILVEAAAAEPPRPLVEQLAPEGRLVLPVGIGRQSLTVVRGENPEDPETQPLGTVAFQPLLVEGEQAGSIERNRTVREDRERAERLRERRTGWEQDWIDWDGDGSRPE
ncbi:protein-L-isoaspartate O-methyltransferase [Halorussus gelatinilyticus]|uniref:protein-L-isoaspartate(D-aspartate) O-methyltransferase n=1 Tax=Halorussus gelatinilyticus TaxID=2937524 RepID=A0A8U0INE1_9EURY|nr:protein-L-isoaspartate O-methyltransferase [Halorussus gelatinilyticus]UPW02268.1 protein-L-isoaspartate O-methyltransferase [Halorussus gelatinilyticus]